MSFFLLEFFWWWMCWLWNSEHGRWKKEIGIAIFERREAGEFGYWEFMLKRMEILTN